MNPLRAAFGWMLRLSRWVEGMNPADPPRRQTNSKFSKIRARCHAAGFELSQSGRRYIVTSRSKNGPGANCGTLTEVGRFLDGEKQMNLVAVMEGGMQ